MTRRMATGSSVLMVAVALGIVYVVWGSTYMAIRVAVRHLPPLESAGWRYLSAAVILGAVLALRGGWRRLKVERRELLGSAVMGLLLPCIGNGLVVMGESMGAPSGIAALLVAAVPLWIILYRAVSGDRPRRRTTAGVLLGFAGLVGLVAADGIDGQLDVLACVVVLVATVGWSFGSWLMPQLRLPKDPFVMSFYEMVFGGAFLMLGGVVRGEPMLPTAVSAESWLAWAYLVVIGSVVAYTAYVWVLNAAPISLVATYAYVNPVVAVFLGWLILSEPLSAPVLLGGAVVVVGVAIVVSAERRPRPGASRLPPDGGSGQSAHRLETAA